MQTEPRFIIIYLKDENIRCLRLVQVDEVSEEITENEEESLKRDIYNKLNKKNVFVHRVKPGMGNIINYSEIDIQSWVIELDELLLDIWPSLHEFIECIQGSNTIKAFHQFINSSLNRAEKPN